MTIVADTVVLNIIFEVLFYGEKVASVWKAYPIRIQDYKSTKSIPYFDQNGRISLPFGTAHIYINHTREYARPA